MRLLLQLARGANFNLARFIFQLMRRQRWWRWRRKHGVLGWVFVVVVTILVGRSGRIGGGSRNGDGNVIGKHGHKLVVVKAVKRRRRMKKGGVTTLIGKWGFKESNGVANGSPVKAAAGGGEVKKIIDPRRVVVVGGGGRRRRRRRRS